MANESQAVPAVATTAEELLEMFGKARLSFLNAKTIVDFAIAIGAPDSQAPEDPGNLLHPIQDILKLVDDRLEELEVALMKLKVTQ